MKEINQIDIGNVYRLDEEFQGAIGDELTQGCFRKLVEYLPRLTKFYLRKDRKEALQWFGKTEKRNRAQTSAAIRLWRSRGQLSIREENSKEVLFYKNLRVLRSSEVNRVVADEFHRTKGSGARKIVCSLKENFVGLSKNRVQDILNKDKLHYRRNARFLNKAILKPIRARDVQVRHQVDLMDLGKRGSVEFKGIVYRYVLSIMDVFSRFIWLRPLARKTSKVVAAELKATIPSRKEK